MDVQNPSQLLGGISPQRFMRRHWQKKPLLVRGAIPDLRPVLDRSALFDLASREGVESRLVEQGGSQGWRMRRGPFSRRALPPLSRVQWTLLVQGVDLHVDAAHDVLQRFRFVPQARLDDLMISYATDGGGVGPHFDSYDVFLLQASGKRLWRYGRQKDLSLQDDVPLKILSNFEPEEEHLLEPGDMLYLPPRYAHDGIAQGECQTYSIGFRAPRRGELARELLQRLADDTEEIAADAMYRDASQPSTATPGAIPPGLVDFARDAVSAVLTDPLALERALGEWLTEPKPDVWFDPSEQDELGAGVVLDRRTRMMYDGRHVFVNGESWRASGRDAALMRRLADERSLDAADVRRASPGARELIATWCVAGWARACHG